MKLSKLLKPISLAAISCAAAVPTLVGCTITDTWEAARAKRVKLTLNTDQIQLNEQNEGTVSFDVDKAVTAEDFLEPELTPRDSGTHKETTVKDHTLSFTFTFDTSKLPTSNKVTLLIKSKNYTVVNGEITVKILY